jgi:hypothetical protein
MRFTAHAQTRLEQRGISSFAVDCVLEFGDVEYNRGCEVYRMSRKAEKRLHSYMGGLSSEVSKSIKNIYVVIEGDDVLTVCRKNRHLKRDR